MENRSQNNEFYYRACGGQFDLARDPNWPILHPSVVCRDMPSDAVHDICGAQHETGVTENVIDTNMQRHLFDYVCNRYVHHLRSAAPWIRKRNGRRESVDEQVRNVVSNEKIVWVTTHRYLQTRPYKAIIKWKHTDDTAMDG